MTEEQKENLFIKAKVAQDKQQRCYDERSACEMRIEELNEEIKQADSYVVGITDAICAIGLWQEYEAWRDKKN